MRRLALFLVIFTSLGVCGTDARAAGDDDYPCFLVQQGPLFVAALEHDLDTSRQRMIDKIVGDAASDSEKGNCPAATRAFADFRRDLIAAFDATTSKARVLARLRPVWQKRW